MPPRSQPTERQRRLGAELKKLRLGAGLSGDKAAEIIDADRQRISNIEAGRVDVPRNGLYQLLRAYGCSEGPLFEGLMAMAQERGKGWWNAYRTVMGRSALDLAELEFRSTAIDTHELLYVPGILQTEEYAQAVCQSAGDDQAVIKQYVEFRMERQQIILSDQPVALRAVIHEAALHARPGTSQTMRKQLLRLIEFSRLPHVTVQVFPYEAGMYSAFSRDFTIFGVSTPELSTVRVEQPIESTVVRDHEGTSRYARIFDKLAGMALPAVDPEALPESNEGQDSLGLIQHLLYTL